MIETKVKVNLSIYVNVSTDSFPEDIDEETMKDILIDNLSAQLLDSEGERYTINGWEYENIKVIEDGVAKEEEEVEETVVELANGNEIRSYSETQEAGDYIRIVDKDGNELAYWDHKEWQEDPIGVMGAIINATYLEADES